MNYEVIITCAVTHAQWQVPDTLLKNILIFQNHVLWKMPCSYQILLAGFSE